jgi:hypothetical protein
MRGKRRELDQKREISDKRTREREITHTDRRYQSGDISNKREEREEERQSERSVKQSFLHLLSPPASSPLAPPPP